jgi:ABC-2 type transport system ATP-binding protein
MFQDKDVIIQVDNLTKDYGYGRGVFDITLKVHKGECYGYLGPNGAGKTTTIKIILGLQSIDSGEVIINGNSITKNFSKAIERVGAIVENPDSYMYLSGRKNLELVANMYDNIPKERIDEVIKLVGLENRIQDKVSKYSLGMRQRLGIAIALLNKPNLLILDEPTNGLDPEGIKELRDLLKNLAKKEKTSILISSHNLSELESFCTDICIIQNGVILDRDSIKTFKKNKDTEYIFEVDDANKASKIIENVRIITDTMFGKIIERDKVPELIKKMIENNIDIYEVRLRELTLEEAFLNKTGGNKID